MRRSPRPDGDGGDGVNDADRRRELLKWAGLGTQVVASVGVSVFLGVKADKWLKLSFPILSWALPLVVITGLLINLIREGSKKKNGK